MVNNHVNQQQWGYVEDVADDTDEDDTDEDEEDDEHD